MPGFSNYSPLQAGHPTLFFTMRPRLPQSPLELFAITRGDSPRVVIVMGVFSAWLMLVATSLFARKSALKAG
jgi:hypothetical protein